MNITALIKQIGKRKNILAPITIDIGEPPKTLRDLITQIVTINVTQFNENTSDQSIVSYLTPESIEDQSITGKIGFGTKYNSSAQDMDKAIENALVSFEDGIYRVFISGEEKENLDESINIYDGDEVVFIKLVMLAGRMW